MFFEISVIFSVGWGALYPRRGKTMTHTPNEFLALAFSRIKDYLDSSPFDLYLFIDGKYLKLANKKDDVSKIYKKFTDKGLKTIFVLANEFDEFQNKYGKLKAEDDSSNKKMVLKQEATILAKELNTKLAIFNASVDIDQCEKIAGRTIDFIATQSDFLKLFLQFKELKPQDYQIGVLTSFLSQFILRSFYWSTDSIMEKVSLASFVADISLTDIKGDEHLQFDKLEIDKNDLQTAMLWHPIKSKEEIEK